MPLLKAIESGIRQTECLPEREGRCGVWTFSNASYLNPKVLEWTARVGDSPVGARIDATREGIRSTVRRNSCGNMGGTYIQP